VTPARVALSVPRTPSEAPADHSEVHWDLSKTAEAIEKCVPIKPQSGDSADEEWDLQRTSKAFEACLAAFSKSDNWEERVEFLRLIARISSEQFCQSDPFFTRSLKALCPSLKKQITDLRSAVVKAATESLSILAVNFGHRIEEMTVALLPTLLSRLYVTKKVISQACDDALRQLVVNSCTIKSLPHLMDGTKDSHNIVRSRCFEYVAILLETVNSVENMQASDIGIQLDKFETAILLGVRDKDAAARKFVGSRLFPQYKRLFPGRVEKVLNQLTPSERTLLEK
jgi:hypothetical protein